VSTRGNMTTVVCVCGGGDVRGAQVEGCHHEVGV
jgi:hypothetical protein